MKFGEVVLDSIKDDSHRYRVSTDYPEDIGKALLRADCYYHADQISMTFRIKSRNLEAPLTDYEKNRIKTYLGLVGYPGMVIFE